MEQKNERDEEQEEYSPSSLTHPSDRPGQVVCLVGAHGQLDQGQAELRGHPGRS